MSAKLRQNMATAKLSATIPSPPLHERTPKGVSTNQRTGTCPFVDVLVLFPAAVSVQRPQPTVARGSNRPSQGKTRVRSLGLRRDAGARPFAHLAPEAGVFDEPHA